MRSPNLTPRTLAALAATSLVACAGQTASLDDEVAAPVVTSTRTAAAPIPAAPSEDWRKEPPKPGPDPTVTLPVPTQAKLANGLTVLAYTQASLPLVSFAVVTRGGSATDPAGKGGLTSLAYSLLDEGAGGRDALALADAVADLGASLASGATQDRGLVGITGLSKNTEPMLALLADTVLRPALAAPDFERIKGQTLAGILRARGSPQGLAFEAVPAMIYGDKHPYGHPVQGLEATVQKLSLADAKSQLAQLLSPEQSVFIAVGDITLERATALAEQHFGKWKAGKRAVVTPAPVAPRPRAEITVLDLPGAAQTFVIVGRPIFGRGHADEIPFLVLNEVLGGSFASRLNLNLREDKGYTYGAFSASSPRRGVGAFYAGAAVRADATIPSIKEVFAELERMKTMPASADELTRAQDGLVRSLPGDFQELSSVAAQAADLFVYGLPLDYLSTYVTAVRKVTEDDAERVTAAYLTPDTLQLLLVGDAKSIVPEAEKLGLGKVIVKK